MSLGSIDREVRPNTLIVILSPFVKMLLVALLDEMVIVLSSGMASSAQDNNYNVNYKIRTIVITFMELSHNNHSLSTPILM